ncbi:MAG: K+ channel TrkA-N [Blastocatellia bacterium]|nr:MAG: K+ channel TrkA-N [Blastocatellia bacterium]
MFNELTVAVVIVSLCLLLHVATIMLMARALIGWWERTDRKGRIVHFSVLMILVFAVIMLLHVAEAALWAGFYYARQLFSDYETSLYFSFTSYTTIGYGDILLPQRWRLLGAIEGISGVLLCGISTAFIFAIMNAMFQERWRQLRIDK